MRSLAERLQAYEQQKARLAGMEAKLKDAEKRARTRRLIEIGGLVEKAGLSGLAVEALYGGFLSLRENSENRKQLDQWAAAGAQAISGEDPGTDKDRGPMVLSFPKPLPKEASAQLRANGFRFNKVLQHWEGFAVFDKAQQLAVEYGGDVRTVSSSASPPEMPKAEAV